MIQRIKDHPYLTSIIIAAFVLGFAIAGWYFTRSSPQEGGQQPVQVQQGPRYPQGWDPHPEETRQFLRSLGKPGLRDRGPELFQQRADHDTFLYRALYEAYENYAGEKWVVGRQGIGDCVSWGFAHAADIHLAVMWELGETAEWRPAATEAIYGGSRVEARGITFAGWSDGSYGAAAAKWLRNWGIIFRQQYDDPFVDLRKYSAQRAKNWGAYGCGGKDDNGRLDEKAKKHPVRNVALVQSFEEAAKAIQSGYPVAVCSNQGFANVRDRDGFARAQGTWYHCMCFIAVRFDRPGLLCLNSWGPNWISGPKWPDDMPDGSFWVEARIVDRMLGQGDSFAVSGYEGFPYKPLDHGDWVMHTRDQELEQEIAKLTPDQREQMLHHVQARRQAGEPEAGIYWRALVDVLAGYPLKGERVVTVERAKQLEMWREEP